MKGVVYVLCGLAGGVAGGFLVQSLKEEPTQRTVDRTATRDVEAHRRLDALLAKVDALARTASAADAAEPVAAQPPEKTETAAGDPATRGPAGDAPQKLATPAEIREFAAGFTTGAFDQQAIGRLWGWMFNHRDQIPALVESLQESVEKDPNNADLHTALATAYVGQLNYNTPQGAQQGIVWMKASASYDKAIGLDNEHWQARYGKAFGTTFIPEQFGMRPAAIRQFEELRKIQEGRAPRPEYADTYLQLGRLYGAEGNVAKGRKIWREGLLLFPDHKKLKAQLEVSEKE